MDPPVSSPRDVAHRNPAVADPEPVDDVPGLRSRSQGLQAGPKAELTGSPSANSLMFSLPSKIAPACFRLARTVASSSGTNPARILEASVVVMPALWIWSFTATGTPWSGPR